MPQGLPTVVAEQLIEAAHINSIADRIVGRFATTAERDAAIPSPVTGMSCSVAGRILNYAGGVWRTTSQAARVYGSSVAFDPIVPTGSVVIPQTNFTMPATGMVTMTYQLSLAAVAGGSTQTTWEAVIEGTSSTTAGVSRALHLTGWTLIFLSGTHTIEMAAGARYGRVTVKRVAGDLNVRSFAGAYGIEITY